MSIVEHLAKPVDSLPVRMFATKLLDCLTPRVTRSLAIAALGVVVLASAFFAVEKPAYNWDMAPYIAISLEDRVSDPVELHRQAWQGIEERASQGQWYQLTEGNAYNADEWKNPQHFFSQLTMYRVKIAYMAAIRLLDHIVDPVTATVIISCFSTLAFGLITMVWMIRYDFAESGLLLAPFLLLAGYFNMALTATPDLLMAVFGLAGIMAVVKGRPWLSVPLLYIMFLVRPDGIVFLFALLLAALAFGYARLPMLAAFALAVVTYSPIVHAAQHPGWWPHFYFSNIALQNDMTGFDPAFTVVDYLRGIVRGISVSLRDNNWPMLLGMLLIGWWMIVRSGRRLTGQTTMMLTAIVLCFGGKFVSFPLPDDRIYFMLIAAFGIILAEAWKPRFDYNADRASRSAIAV